MIRNGKNTSEVPWTTLTSVGMLLLIIVGAFWALAFGPIQDKFTSDDKRIMKLEEADRRIQLVLDQRRGEFPTQFEFIQFEKRVTERLDLIQKQLLLLEQTRPTTGELGAIAKNNESLVGKIEDRVKSLEIFVRQPLKSNQ